MEKHLIGVDTISLRANMMVFMSPATMKQIMKRGSTTANAVRLMDDHNPTPMLVLSQRHKAVNSKDHSLALNQVQVLNRQPS